MNVNLNSFNPSVLPEWGVAAGAPKFADAVGGVSSDVRAGEFLLSVEDGGAARSVSFQMPELDPPQIADGNDIAILCDKLGSGDVLNLSSDDVDLRLELLGLHLLGLGHRKFPPIRRRLPAGTVFQLVELCGV